MKPILVVDLGVDYYEGANRLVEMLEAQGGGVVRPKSLVEFTKLIGITRDGWTCGDAPLILNMHFGNLPDVRKALHAAEAVGLRVMNRMAATMRSLDRLALMNSLRGSDIRVPDFFVGHPLLVPEEFGDEVVVKHPEGHLVFMVRRGLIHSLDECIYVERIIQNPEGYITTVYSVCGMIFGVKKHDSLKTTERKKELLPDIGQGHRVVVEKIRRITGLDFLGVDFIDGTVIDINAFPNFFFHPPAIEVMAEAVLAEARA